MSLQMFGHITNMNNVHPFEVVGRVSETQFQVGDN